MHKEGELTRLKGLLTANLLSIILVIDINMCEMS
jgi:hypothetical protein